MYLIDFLHIFLSIATWIFWRIFDLVKLNIWYQKLDIFKNVDACDIITHICKFVWICAHLSCSYKSEMIWLYN